MEKITKKQALQEMLGNKGVTAFINNKAFNALTSERLNRYIDSKRINLCKAMLYEFKPYKNGYSRKCLVTDYDKHDHVTVDTEDINDYDCYMYENKDAKMIILVHKFFNGVIVNTFFKGPSVA